MGPGLPGLCLARSTLQPNTWAWSLEMFIVIKTQKKDKTVTRRDLRVALEVK